MQPLALFIDVEMVFPNPIAAKAIAEPTIARMRAYSAAEAPESSLSMLIKVFMFRPFL